MHKTIVHIVTLLLMLAALPTAESQARGKFAGCMYDGIALHGRVQQVRAFADIKVQVVRAFEDLSVQRVNAFPDSCGKWQMVDSFPDFTVQFVDAFPDITIRYVDAFPGVR